MYNVLILGDIALGAKNSGMALHLHQQNSLLYRCRSAISNPEFMNPSNNLISSNKINNKSHKHECRKIALLILLPKS